MSFLGDLQRVITERAPYWIARGPGGIFLQALGVTLDNAQATLLYGLRQTRPGTAFADALSYIAADRGIRRYPTEPLASWRSRLQRWRQIRHFAGTHYGQMISVVPYFLPAVPRIRIVHQAGGLDLATWHTLNPDGTYEVYQATPSNWQWDTHPLSWSRFWVIIYVDATIGPVPNTWNDGHTWNDGAIWDGYLTDTQTADILSIILDSKAAHSTCAGIIYATDPTSFNPSDGYFTLPDGTTNFPDGTWSMSVDLATNLPTRNSTAIFAYDNGAP